MMAPHGGPAFDRILDVQASAGDAWALALALVDSLGSLEPEDFEIENNHVWGGRVEATRRLAATLQDRLADLASALDPIVILCDPPGPPPTIRPAA